VTEDWAEATEQKAAVTIAIMQDVFMS
jgi:hypothetical protein